jgi:uncharacterized protein (TIGR00369 family)
MMDKLQYYQGMVGGSVPHPPIADLIGFKVIEAEKGKIVIELVCNEMMANSIGAVQGGIIVTIADAAMGMAAMTLMDDKHYSITAELKINFLRQPGMERLISTGRIVHPGRRLMMGEAEVRSENGKMIAKATSTLMVLENDTFD